MDESLVKILPLLVPLILIQMVLLFIAIFDLANRKRVKGGNKAVWALVIVLINVIGPAIYLMLGREEDSGED